MEFKFIKQFFKGFIIALKMGKSKKPSTSGAAAIIAPMKTLDETDSAVLVGTLVWGKFDGYPWWPGKNLLIFSDLIEFSYIFFFFNRISCDDR